VLVGAGLEVGALVVGCVVGAAVAVGECVAVGEAVTVGAAVAVGAGVAKRQLVLKTYVFISRDHGLGLCLGASMASCDGLGPRREFAPARLHVCGYASAISKETNAQLKIF